MIKPKFPLVISEDEMFIESKWHLMRVLKKLDILSSYDYYKIEATMKIVAVIGDL